MFNEFRPTKPSCGKLNYLLTTPTGFDPAKESLPMIIFLHGAGERGDDIKRILGPRSVPRYFNTDPDFKGLRVITLSPQCPDGMIWNELITSVKELADTIIEKYNVDKTKVSVTGLSMGGFGTWSFITRYPDFVFRAAPICGGGVSWCADRLLNIPIRTFHGTADDSVPIRYTMEMADTIRSLGGTNCTATYLPGVGHDSWIYAYEQTDLIEWLAGKN